MGFANFITNKFFNIIHRGNLVYNQCWEDPRLDREALKIDDQSVIVCITSAGCNILDYLLDSPKKIYAVDMNPRQNHLLELKIAGIRSLDFETFFQFFGYGQFKGSREIYKTKLRHKLSPSAGIFWDKNIEYFSGGGWRSSFYFRGTSGTFARIVNSYINYIPGMRPAIDALVNSKSIQEQAVIYSVICHKFWRGAINWLMNRSATLSLLGIPRAQRTVLERRYDGRIGKFARERVDQVFSKMNFSDNYFWRVYLTGSYTKDCCPEYLKEANFNRLKSGLVDRVSIHTSSIESFLRSKEKTLPINRFVLLDHMDWLAHHNWATSPMSGRPL